MQTKYTYYLSIWSETDKKGLSRCIRCMRNCDTVHCTVLYKDCLLYIVLYKKIIFDFTQELIPQQPL